MEHTCSLTKVFESDFINLKVLGMGGFHVFHLTSFVALKVKL